MQSSFYSVIYDRESEVHHQTATSFLEAKIQTHGELSSVEVFDSGLQSILLEFDEASGLRTLFEPIFEGKTCKYVDSLSDKSSTGLGFTTGIACEEVYASVLGKNVCLGLVEHKKRMQKIGLDLIHYINDPGREYQGELACAG
jgi:hypothetical protein